MTNKSKKAKVDDIRQSLPEHINLHERMPSGHPRYAFLGASGEGRMDRTTLRKVPQYLVDAAIKTDAIAVGLMSD